MHIFIFSSVKLGLFTVMDPEFSFTLDVFLKYPYHVINMSQDSRKNKHEWQHHKKKHQSSHIVNKNADLKKIFLFSFFL